MILLRHGQSAFNLHFTRFRRDPGIEDPSLTPEGEEQAEAAARDILARHRITRIVSSPFRRALQTAAPAARLTGLPVSVTAGVRERFAFRCDVGSAPAALARDWPGHDFSALPDRWWDEDGNWDGYGDGAGTGPDGARAIEPEEVVVRRAAAFRERMRGEPDPDTTLVVSHWGFLLALSGQSLQNGTWCELDPFDPPPGRIVWRP